MDCPAGARGALFYVLDGDQDGSVSAVVLPPGVAKPAWNNLPRGTQQASSNMDDASTVVVLSVPHSAGGIAPFGDDVQKIALDIADKLPH